ncbi:CRISPR-associated protein Csx20 [Desulfococcus sp.]|uniref:CRISPR-associated protein Csx20 n=1 Tax=Desulfococcus sp. TaxID=2025834 RepID=UPI0035942550
MSGTLLLIFNHTFTETQKADALASLGVNRIVMPPEHIQAVWGQIPPDLPALSDYLAPVREWIVKQAKPGDHVLVQGDFGACYLMVQVAYEKGLIPVYSTTRREALETVQPDGTIKMVHHFKHQMFRRFGC